MSYLTIETQDTQYVADQLVCMMTNPAMFSQETLTKDLEPYVKAHLDKFGPFKVERRCTCSRDFCEVFDAGVMGRGVKAKRTIWANTHIGCYTGVLRSVSEKHNGDWRYNYTYGLGGYYVDASGEDTCMMALLNHSEKDENVKVEYGLHEMPDGTVECHIVFVAKRAIMRTEELFIDYGHDYWNYAKKRGIVEYELDQMGNKRVKNNYADELSGIVEKVSTLCVDEDDYDVGTSSSPYFIDKSQKRITDYMIQT